MTGTFQVGCSQALFSGQSSLSEPIPLAIPPATNFEGCSPFSQEINPEKYSGRAILVNRGKCMFCVKILNALTVNASAVIVSNSIDSIPIIMTWSSLCPAVADNP